MSLEKFKAELLAISNETERTTFIKKNFFHGTPFVFINRDRDYYNFSKRISDHFKINCSDINIVGSARFGFSPYKFTEFSLESDIDVTLCNEYLFEKYLDLISDYTYKVKNQEISLRNDQKKKYIKFLKYISTGWIRPDMLPSNTVEFKEIRESWYDFFKTISYGKSEVGNYKVTAALFKNQSYAEKYYKYRIDQLQKKIK